MDYAYKVCENLTCDVLVVGGGPSGLTAAVQAAELGLKTIIIEGTPAFGGNGPNTEGVFGVDSDMQKAQGLTIDMCQIIDSECKAFNYNIDPLKWKDLIDNSGDNINWLQAHGVGFSGIIDECKGYARGMKPFHWFRKRESDGRGDGNLLVDPLIESAKKLGVTMFTCTRGKELITADGRVCGIYAENTETKDIIKIGSGAVILATGGFADNDEMMADRGFNVECVYHRGNPGHNGDGIRMAVEVGAADMSRMRTYLDKLYIYPLGPYSSTTVYVGMKGLTMWTNENGERFVDENCGEVDSCFCGTAVRTQKHVFTLFDSAFVEAYKDSANELQADIQTLIKADLGNCFTAETIEELAEKAGMDKSTLCANVDRYNEMCNRGEDVDFAKEASKLIPIKTAPYYLIRLDMGIWTSLGGLHTNRKFEVLTPMEERIPGLYCVGVDGCELYRDCYTHTVPGSANGNNINSGRTASLAASEYIKSLQ